MNFPNWSSNTSSPRLIRHDWKFPPHRGDGLMNINRRFHDFSFQFDMSSSHNASKTSLRPVPKRLWCLWKTKDCNASLVIFDATLTKTLKSLQNFCGRANFVACPLTETHIQIHVWNSQPERNQRVWPLVAASRRTAFFQTLLIKSARCGGGWVGRLAPF